jgi:hypothetical protein
MPTNDPPPLSDRQARTVIIAAERLGFEREPDLYAPWYDHALHEDASDAARYLRLRDPDALREALVAEEPIRADCAADRITESGRFSLADADVVIRAATERGFTPPSTDLPLMPAMLTWDQAKASVAFLWERHPSYLAEVLGDLVRLAPLPASARVRGEMFSCYDA